MQNRGNYRKQGYNRMADPEVIELSKKAGRLKKSQLFKRENTEFSDSRVRIYAGYVFLWKFARKNSEEAVKDELLSKVNIAYGFLLNCKAVSILQKQDFDNALKILEDF